MTDALLRRTAVAADEGCEVPKLERVDAASQGLRRGKLGRSPAIGETRERTHQLSCMRQEISRKAQMTKLELIACVPPRRQSALLQTSKGRDNHATRCTAADAPKILEPSIGGQSRQCKGQNPRRHGLQRTQHEKGTPRHSYTWVIQCRMLLALPPHLGPRNCPKTRKGG